MSYSIIISHIAHLLCVYSLPKGDILLDSWYIIRLISMSQLNVNYRFTTNNLVSCNLGNTGSTTTDNTQIIKPKHTISVIIVLIK